MTTLRPGSGVARRARRGRVEVVGRSPTSPAQGRRAGRRRGRRPRRLQLSRQTTVEVLRAPLRVDLEAAACLGERLGEGAAIPIDSPTDFICVPSVGRAGELLERERGNLDDDVVERGSKLAGRRPVVRSFGISSSGVADGELGGHLGDRIAGRLRRKREERETRGFISITRSSPVSRLRANWMFEPRTRRRPRGPTAAAASRSSW